MTASPHEDMKMENYMDVAMNLLYDIRLCIEGAVVLFEDEAAPLNRLAIMNDMPTAAVAFDTIGAALYDLRRDIKSLYEAYAKESTRQMKV